MVKFSLVIPAFNEEKKIKSDLLAAREFLAAQSFTSEILVIDDGSVDQTTIAASDTWQKFPPCKNVTFRVLRYEDNRGKGYAVKYGVQKSNGETVAFADAGLCVPYKFLQQGMQLLDNGADIAIGSRRHGSAQIVRSQPMYRRLGSKLFWYIVRLLFGVRVSDTQCGFKLYRRAVAHKIFSGLQTSGFMFDIEALAIASQLGLRVEEFPVEWSNDSDSRFHPVWGSFRNFKDLFYIYFKKKLRPSEEGRNV